jgi:hypothetical protein
MSLFRWHSEPFTYESLWEGKEYQPPKELWAPMSKTKTRLGRIVSLQLTPCADSQLWYYEARMLFIGDLTLALRAPVFQGRKLLDSRKGATHRKLAPLVGRLFAYPRWFLGISPEKLTQYLRVRRERLPKMIRWYGDLSKNVPTGRYRGSKRSECLPGPDGE